MEDRAVESESLGPQHHHNLHIVVTARISNSSSMYYTSMVLMLEVASTSRSIYSTIVHTLPLVFTTFPNTLATTYTLAPLHHSPLSQPSLVFLPSTPPSPIRFIGAIRDAHDSGRDRPELPLPPRKSGRRDMERDVGYRITDSDRQAHAYTRHLMEIEARLSREAWRQSMDASCSWPAAVTSEMLKADHRRSAEIRELRIADRTRQQLIQTLTMMQDSRDPLEVLHSQSCQRRLVAVHRLDHVMASHFVYSLLSITGLIPASKALGNGMTDHTSGSWWQEGLNAVARELHLSQDFMKCKPLYFKGTEGVVELTQWFERMETVFRISNCSVENQIKFSTCTLLAGALTWNEMKKLEAELRNLKVKGTDVIGYNQRFQELALLSSKPKTMQEAVEMATELMDKKVSTIAER
ncbi:hypothetical protein Tco_1002600 [Tanacetum coccineum]|uniref:Retrotransposon gag domain-containing protein n=1 Tax=Tanacetum coccineum TaxID=301880 RepID=A0ABQ5F8K3_9ASTR